MKNNHLQIQAEHIQDLQGLTMKMMSQQFLLCFPPPNDTSQDD